MLNRLLLITTGILIVGGLSFLTAQGIAHPHGVWANGWVEDDCSGFVLYLFGVWCGSLIHKHLVKPMKLRHSRAEAHEEWIARRAVGHDEPHPHFQIEKPR
jgi:membrane protein DedA with SNARE-associated domain